MKLVAGAVFALALSSVAFANNQNHDPEPPTSHNWRCFAYDAQGQTFHFNLNWDDSRVAYVQRQALAQCEAGSRRPETCRPAGCEIY